VACPCAQVVKVFCFFFSKKKRLLPSFFAPARVFHVEHLPSFAVQRFDAKINNPRETTGLRGVQACGYGTGS
jgi:hypothetical protein